MTTPPQVKSQCQKLILLAASIALPLGALAGVDGGGPEAAMKASVPMALGLLGTLPGDRC